MNRVSILAHFDGAHILLDEPYSLEPNAKLLVTVLPEQDEEREDWLRLPSKGLQTLMATTSRSIRFRVFVK